jgi:hypothetical protein
VAARIDLVEDASFREAQWALGEVLLKKADLARVEAIEG